jgi:hypothetical protein
MKLGCLVLSVAALSEDPDTGHILYKMDNVPAPLIDLHCDMDPGDHQMVQSWFFS